MPFKKNPLHRYKMAPVGTSEYVPPAADGLKVFYVDGNNHNVGDGSIGNPFQTLDLALDKVIGNGSAIAPNYENATISVAAYAGYFTSRNLVVKGLSWHFEAGAIVDYWGFDWLFDLSILPEDQISIIKVFGAGQFKTYSGGFINAVGTANTSYYRRIEIEAYSFESYYNNSINPEDRVLFNIVNNANGLNGFGFNCRIDLGYRILSWTQTVFNVDARGALELTGGGIYYGTNIEPAYTARLLKIGRSQGVNVSNCILWAGWIDYYISILGIIRNVIFSNCEVTSTHNTNLGKPNKFLEIGSACLVDVDGGGSQAVSQLMLNYVHTEKCYFMSNEIITYNGVDTFNRLELNFCKLDGTISQNITLNPIDHFGNQKKYINILNGDPTISFPTFDDNQIFSIFSLKVKAQPEFYQQVQVLVFQEGSTTIESLYMEYSTLYPSANILLQIVTDTGETLLPETFIPTYGYEDETEASLAERILIAQNNIQQLLTPILSPSGACNIYILIKTDIEIQIKQSIIQ